MAGAVLAGNFLSRFKFLSGRQFCQLQSLPLGMQAHLQYCNT